MPRTGAGASFWSVVAAPQSATTRLKIGKARFTAKVVVTPAGLLAIGGLVSAILLAVPPIIRAAGQARSARTASDGGRQLR